LLIAFSQQAAKKKTTAPATKAPEAKPEETSSKPAAGGKGKKLPTALAKLQAQQEALRRREEEKARLEAEEKARIEEEERREAEEEKRREEAKALKKQKEKEKIEQQKKDGTFLTKAQREEKLRNEMKLKQMLAAGVKVGGTEGGEKKKPVYDNKKKKGGRKNPEEIKVFDPGESVLLILISNRLKRRGLLQRLLNVRNKRPSESRQKTKPGQRERPLKQQQQRKRNQTATWTTGRSRLLKARTT